MEHLKSFLFNKNRLLLGLGFLAIYFVIFLYVKQSGLSQQQVSDFIQPYGYYGYFIIYFLQILISLSPIPDGGLAIIAVLLYGPYKAFLLILPGMLTASLIHYHIAKVLGNKFFFRFFPGIKPRVERFRNRATIGNLILYRFFAMVSFDVVAYISGLAGIPLPRYIVSAILGFIPIIMSSIFIALGIFADSKFDVFISWMTAGIIALVISFFAKRSKFNNL